MERAKYFFLTVMLLFLLPPDVSGEDNYRRKIYLAYINGDMAGWEAVIREIENGGTDSFDGRMDLLNYYYGYTAFLIGSKRNKEAEGYIKKGEELIGALLEVDPENAALYAYKGSFTGFKIGLNKLRAPRLGPQSMKWIAKARELDADDIQVLADRGNMLYYAPRLFGGNKKEGMESIRQAIRRMESEGKAADNWFYLNLLTSLAQYHEERGELPAAVEIYEKILRTAPGYKWVRDELYPSAIR